MLSTIWGGGPTRAKSEAPAVVFPSEHDRSPKLPQDFRLMNFGGGSIDFLSQDRLPVTENIASAGKTVNARRKISPRGKDATGTGSPARGDSWKES